jgi:inner membrane protein
MDNLTHSLTGWMLARGFLGRGEKGAALMMVLAANAPDLDAVGGFRGTLSYLDYHRGYTHSLACAPVLALAPLLIARLVARARIGWISYLACLAGVLSHLLLDWTNVYGIRLLLPFSSRWLRLDINDIIDPWILLLLIAAVAAPALVGLVSSEIASRKVPAPVRGWAQFALAALLLYEGGRWVMHQRALAVLGAHLYGGGLPIRVSATPGRISPFRWRGIVEGDGFVYEVPVDLTSEFDPGAGRAEYPTVSSSAIDAVRQTPAFRDFASFNQLPFWRVSTALNATKVELIDLRFGTPQAPGFEAVATVDAQGQVHNSRFTFGAPR